MSNRQRSLVDNAADPQQVAEGERVMRERARRSTEALQRLANTQDGEILFEQIVEDAKLFATSFDTSPHVMAFTEGERNLGIKILNRWLAVRPDALASLLARRVAENKRTPRPMTEDSTDG